MIRKIIQEPLLHFLLVGALLFVVYGYVGDQSEAIDSSRRIVVNDDRLLEYLQLRSKTVSPDNVRKQMESMSGQELALVVESFVREEALYREAKALGLDEKDVGVRQRMVRQLEFINQGMLNAAIELGEDDLREFLANNEQRYVEPPTITFTHVFFSSDRRGKDEASQKAIATLRELKSDPDGSPVPFHRAPGYGDRFLYRQNYVKQELDEIRSHFGEAMQQAVFAIQPSDQQWHGPFESLYGFHLVMVTRKSDQRVPEFDEIRKRLEADTYQAKLDQQIRDLEKAVVEGYDIEIAAALQSKLPPESNSAEPNAVTEASTTGEQP